MKRQLTLLAAIAAIFLFSSFTTPPTGPSFHASLVQVPLGNTGKTMSYADFSKLTPAQYEVAAAKDLSLLEKLAFKKVTKKMRKSIQADGTIKNTMVSKAMLSDAAGDFLADFHVGGFALGLFLGPIGIIIAYLLKEGPVKTRQKWAWIGLVFWLLLGGFLFF